MNQKDAKDLVIQAQRKLKEIALDFGSEFASGYRHKIDDLCQKILNSLENNDEMTLDRAKFKLQNLLYELNQEVRSQYDAEWNIDFS